MAHASREPDLDLLPGKPLRKALEPRRSRGTSVLSLPLVQATVSRGSALQNAFGANVDAPTDDGITISGFPGTEGRPGTYFVGLGPGTHAEACVEAVGAAILRIKNPT